LDKPELFQAIIAQGNSIHYEFRNIIHPYLTEEIDKNNPICKAWQLLLQLEKPIEIQFPFPKTPNFQTLIRVISPFVQILPFKSKQEEASYAGYDDHRKFAKIEMTTQNCFTLAYDQLTQNKQSLSEHAFDLTFLLKNIFDNRTKLKLHFE
jgi:hypothetical protein